MTLQERLRERFVFPEVMASRMREAADEIDRLRRERDALKADLARAAMTLHEIAMGATGYLDRDSDLAEIASTALAALSAGTAARAEKAP
jgi:hypothetical protein